MAALAIATLAAAQGPDSGSPFVDAPLDVEALKAPPDRAFEVLLIAFGVFLLVPIAAAAFLGLARLRTIEEAQAKDFRLLRESIDALAGDNPNGPTLETSTDRVVAALADVRQAVERTAVPEPRDSAESDGATRIVRALDTLRQAHAEAAQEAQRRLDDVVAGLRAEPAGGGGPPARKSESKAERSDDAESSLDAERAAAIDRVREQLTASGFRAIQIVTPTAEITDEVLRSGHVVVEARRESAVYKGKVFFQNGVPIDVQLSPGHGMFP